MIIPSIRITLSAPYWLLGYGGHNPPVFKIRGNGLEFELAELNSLRQANGFYALEHFCQISNIDEAAEHVDLVGQMKSGTQPYIDKLLADGWQLCDEGKALAFYSMPQATDPPPPPPHQQPWVPQVVGLPELVRLPRPSPPSSAPPS